MPKVTKTIEGLLGILAFAGIVVGALIFGGVSHYKYRDGGWWYDFLLPTLCSIQATLISGLVALRVLKDARQISQNERDEEIASIVTKRLESEFAKVTKLASEALVRELMEGKYKITPSNSLALRNTNEADSVNATDHR